MARMSIAYEGRRALITVDGPMQTAQIVAFIREHYPKGGFDDALWDFGNSSLAHIRADELRQVAEAVRASSAPDRSGRTVFVCGEDASFGMLRMYTAFAEMAEVPADYAVFRTIAEAEAWLAGPAPDRP